MTSSKRIPLAKRDQAPDLVTPAAKFVAVVTLLGLVWMFIAIVSAVTT